MSSVFISHNSLDKPWVRKLAKRLTEDGIGVWLDEAEINIGDSLIDKISSAIDQTKFVVAVISSNSIESRWVQKELSLAMAKEIGGHQVTVLPLLIQKCTLPPALRDKLYADFTIPGAFEVEYQRLLRAIRVHVHTTVFRFPRDSLGRESHCRGCGRRLNFHPYPEDPNAIGWCESCEM